MIHASFTLISMISIRFMNVKLYSCRSDFLKRHHAMPQWISQCFVLSTIIELEITSLKRHKYFMMAYWLEQASQWHEVYCHDLEVVSSNPGRVEPGVRSTSVPSRTWTQQIYLFIKNSNKVNPFAYNWIWFPVRTSSGTTISRHTSVHCQECPHSNECPRQCNNQLTEAVS